MKRKRHSIYLSAHHVSSYLGSLNWSLDHIYSIVIIAMPQEMYWQKFRQLFEASPSDLIT